MDQAKSLTLTERERRVLKLLFSVDMDALGLPRADQGAVSTMRKKLNNLISTWDGEK